jgi:DNA modification methylase
VTTIIRADALELLDHVAPRSVQACVTSVPYLRQRRYGNDPREAGLEDTLAAYVQRLADIFDRVREALDPTGLAWLNIGDKANGSGGAGGDWNRPTTSTPSTRARAADGPGKFADPAFEEGSYVDAPGAVVAELLRRGWRLRMPIVWDKGRDAPESLTHVRRPRSSHEMIYLLAPSPRARRKADPVTRFYPSMLTETGSVWHFAPGGSGDPHLDPVAGSGTTLRVAEELGRRAVGLDLYGTDDPNATAPEPELERVHPTVAGMKEAGWPGVADYYYGSRLLASGTPWAEVATLIGGKRTPLADSARTYLERTTRSRA